MQGTLRTVPLQMLARMFVHATSHRHCTVGSQNASARVEINCNYILYQE